MSKGSKTLISIVVVVILVALGFFLYGQNGNSDFTNNYKNNGGADTQTSTVISSSSLSNADLNQDMTKVGGQMSGLDSDTATADANLSNP